MVGINLKNISKKYENNDAYSVENFNLDIQEKEFIVFVGPSGCGKSTTLRMIAGLEDITEGELLIDGKLMNNVEPKNRGIAMVFQNYALYPHMTIFDNMALSLKVQKKSKEEIKNRVHQAAEILGLMDFLERKPGELSGGQRQRVALGRAIVREAKIFLMDEPLSNLDAKLRVQMRTEIAKLHQRLGTTTVYVTHDQTEAMTMASRIVIMNDGKIQQIGPPKEVYDKPLNKFVASFIGSPAMNFFDVVYKDGKILVADKSLTVLDPARKMLDSQGYDGKKLTFGIRPEDIHTEAVYLETQPENAQEAEIVVSEMLGSEIMLHLTMEDYEFIAKVNNRETQTVGERIQIVFNMNKAHFFDNETGAVINNI